MRDNQNKTTFMIMIYIICIILFVLVGCEGDDHRKGLETRTYDSGEIIKIVSAEINTCPSSDDKYHTFVYYEDGNVRKLFGAWKPIGPSSTNVKKITVSPEWALPYTVVNFDVASNAAAVKEELDEEKEIEVEEVVNEDTDENIETSSLLIKRVALKIVKREELSKGELEVYRSNESKIDSLVSDYKRLQAKIKKARWSDVE